MAPIACLDNRLFPREVKKYEPDMEREFFVTKFLLGFIAAAFGIIFLYLVWDKLKPKYEAIWKPKLKGKLEDCKEKYEGCKEKFGAWRSPKEPKAPEPAHVAEQHAQVVEADRITTELTPEYLKMTTAVMFPID